MGIENLKKVMNTGNIIEKIILEKALETSYTSDILIDDSIKNLGFEINKDLVSKDLLTTVIYLDTLKNHVLGKGHVYNNYHTIIDRIEKIENTLENINETCDSEILEFRNWLGVSDIFHNTLLAL